MNLRRMLLAAVVGVTAGCVALPDSESEATPGEQQPGTMRSAPVVDAKPAPVPSEPPTALPALPEAQVVVPPVRASEVETLIADFQRLRRLPAAELAREQETARQVFNQLRTDSARMRLAMTMAVPGGPPGDDARALELLDPLVKNPAAPLHTLAYMVASFIQDQRRLAGQLHAAQQNVQGLQQNNHALQQKLDALMTLERSLTERGETGAPRRR
jgi:hypothetical protein